MHYYNEIDPYPAQWLRNLIAAGHIPAGDVDERSITDVQPDDLRGYTQCHFFAGIGGWSLALKLAGWPEDRPVWTGSCPCQPFSSQGIKRGRSDSRHLWPEWQRLISSALPGAIFGEQVPNAIQLGWLDEVSGDLERIGYSVKSAVLPACSVGSPHKRDRIWFVADRDTPLRRAPEIPGYDSRQEPERMGNSAESFWTEHEIHVHEDGRRYAIPSPKSGIQLMVDGFPTRVERVRAFGNAIVPQVAAQVISAYMECRP